MKSVPAFVGNILAKKFTEEELVVIDAKWHSYSNGFRFGNATPAAIVNEARMVLACAKTEVA